MSFPLKFPPRGMTLNIRSFIERRKMAERWEFVQPVYENLRRGDYVWVRYWLDGESFQKFEGTCVSRTRRSLGSSFLLKNTQLGMEQRFFFFNPLILNIEIKPKDPSEDKKK